MSDSGALYERELDDQRSVYVYSMLFNDRIVVGITGADYYERGFCFPKGGSALVSATVWDGEGDPPGPWIKEVGTDRYGPGTHA